MKSGKSPEEMSSNLKMKSKISAPPLPPPPSAPPLISFFTPPSSPRVSEAANLNAMTNDILKDLEQLNHHYQYDALLVNFYWLLLIIQSELLPRETAKSLLMQLLSTNENQSIMRAFIKRINNDHKIAELFKAINHEIAKYKLDSSYQEVSTCLEAMGHDGRDLPLIQFFATLPFDNEKSAELINAFKAGVEGFFELSNQIKGTDTTRRFSSQKERNDELELELKKHYIAKHRFHYYLNEGATNDSNQASESFGKILDLIEWSHKCGWTLATPPSEGKEKENVQAKEKEALIYYKQYYEIYKRISSRRNMEQPSSGLTKLLSTSFLSKVLSKLHQLNASLLSQANDKLIAAEWFNNYYLMQTLRRKVNEQLSQAKPLVFYKREHEVDPNEFPLIQAAIYDKMRQYFEMLFDNAEKILGSPPCNYCVIVAGSAARKEMTPQSDIEAIIVYESDNIQHKTYLELLINLVTIQLLGLNEFPNTNKPDKKHGFYWDEDIDLSKRGHDQEPSMCTIMKFSAYKTIYTWNTISKDQIADIKLYFMLKAAPMFERGTVNTARAATQIRFAQQYINHVDHALTDDQYREVRQRIAMKNLLEHKESFLKAAAKMTQPDYSFNIKNDLLAPFTYLLMDLSFLLPKGLNENNNYKILDELVKLQIIDAEFSLICKHVIMELNRQRLTKTNNQQLRELYTSIVAPLYEALDEQTCEAIKYGEEINLHPLRTLLSKLNLPKRNMDIKEHKLLNEQLNGTGTLVNKSHSDQLLIIVHYLLIVTTVKSLTATAFKELYRDWGIHTFAKQIQLEFYRLLKSSTICQLSISDKEELLSTIRQCPNLDGWRVGMVEEQTEWDNCILSLYAEEVNGFAVKAFLPHGGFLLKSDIVAQLFHREQLKERDDLPGNHNVLPVFMPTAPTTDPSCWFKIRPERPGIETGVSLLDRYLNGVGERAGTPLNQLIKLYLPTEPFYIPGNKINCRNDDNNNERNIKSCVKRLEKEITNNPHLQELNLQECSVTGEHLEAILDFLAVKRIHIKKLILNDNPIDQRGIRRLARYLTETDSLESLHMNALQRSDDPLDQVALTRETVECLARAITTNRTLKHFHCEHNAITDRLMSLLIMGFKNHVSIREINVVGNEIGNNSSSALDVVIKHNKRIMALRVKEYGEDTSIRSAASNNLLEDALTIVQLRRSIPAQLVAHVGGKSIQTCFNHYPDRLSRIDRASFTRTLIRVLLINPDDDKDDDYFLVPIDPNAKETLYKLIRIDSERALSNTTHVKSILFCLNNMFQPLDKEVMAEFLSLDPSLLLESWLNDLIQLQKEYCSMFREIALNKKNAQVKDSPVLLGVPFVKGLAKQIAHRLNLIQAAISLNQQHTISGIELLQKVQPGLYDYYAYAFKVNNFNAKDDSATIASKIKSRFKIIVEGRTSTSFRTDVEQVAISTAAHTTLLGIKETNSILEGTDNTPLQALEEHHKTVRVDLNRIKENLLTCTEQSLHEFKDLSVRQRMILIEDLVFRPTYLPRGLELKRIVGEGNCLFNAVARILNKGPKRLQIETATYLQNHLSAFSSLMESNSPKDPVTILAQNIASIRSNTDHDHTETDESMRLEALMRMLKRPIVLFNKSNNVINTAQLQQLLDANVISGTPIFLLSSDQYQYEELTSIEDPEDTLLNLLRNKHESHPEDTSIPRGLTVEPIKGDGDCLFNAIAKHVYYDHLFLRQIAANYLQSNFDLFLNFVTEDDTSGEGIQDTLVRHIKEIRMQGAWGGDHEIVALMHYLQQPIVVLDRAGRIHNLIHLDNIQFNGPPIFVLYNGINNYDAIQLSPGIDGKEVLHRLLDNARHNVGGSFALRRNRRIYSVKNYDFEFCNASSQHLIEAVAESTKQEPREFRNKLLSFMQDSLTIDALISYLIAKERADREEAIYQKIQKLKTEANCSELPTLTVLVKMLGRSIVLVNPSGLTLFNPATEVIDPLFLFSTTDQHYDALIVKEGFVGTKIVAEFNLSNKDNSNIKQQQHLLKAMIGIPFRRLDLRKFCLAINDDNLEPIIIGAGDYLESLNLSNCTNITARTLKTLEAKCRNLRTLFLKNTFVQQIKHGETLLQFMHSAPKYLLNSSLALLFPNLVEIYLDDNTTLKEMRLNCPALKLLSASNCSNLINIKTKSLLLQSVTLTGCVRLEELGIRVLSKLPEVIAKIKLEGTQIKHASLREKYPFLATLELDKWGTEFVKLIESALDETDNIETIKTDPNIAGSIRKRLEERLSQLNLIFELGRNEHMNQLRSFYQYRSTTPRSSQTFKFRKRTSEHQDESLRENDELDLYFSKKGFHDLFTKTIHDKNERVLLESAGNGTPRLEHLKKDGKESTSTPTLLTQTSASFGQVIRRPRANAESMTLPLLNRQLIDLSTDDELESEEEITGFNHMSSQ